MAALDAEATLACYADDARVFDGMAPGGIADKAAWAKGVHAWLDPLTGAGECRIDRRRITEVGDLAIVDGFAFYAADHTEERAETTTQFAGGAATATAGSSSTSTRRGRSMIR